MAGGDSDDEFRAGVERRRWMQASLPRGTAQPCGRNASGVKTATLEVILMAGPCLPSPVSPRFS